MKTTTFKRAALATSVACGMILSTMSYAQEEVLMRVVGNFSGNKIHVEQVERPFFGKLSARDDMQVTYNTMDAIGVEAADALRMLRTGAFDVMSVQIGMASRDDPFFEGVDLAGVAQNLDQQREVVEAYREKMDARLQERFNAKLMTLWPFGPQMLFCNGDIAGVDDLKGKKVRVFTPSMSHLVEGLGATPVTLQFSEVYLALQRGVADCGVTAPTAANSGKWPEVTTHLVPLPLSYSVQGHMMNLDAWNRLNEQQQQELTAAFKEMEQQMWDIAYNVNDDAIACSTGQPNCQRHTEYDMTLVEIDDSSSQLVRDITETAVLPAWGESCNQVYPECTQVWNETVGEATGYTIQ
ncbi:TRAP-type C4-dicarboxylate transport system, substrate-binding protein [Modicisalibacter muralis]|uniref:TRAP-type C4-dicarboxylate transport system, substrate-binding protein n=1 Tax=Modicisalibacter muralis TaxID=119000 RepID=A0A1G9GY78_9GAMM|nr:TRAP transporter substrate-binding protein [Halomonas muralis]SDL05619.1 TRAP-type C4-dicarboxylate transport system, substrate-binding protein [Halomonas muralis]